MNKSSRGRRLTAPSHITGHAGPHPAVHQDKRNSLRWLFPRLVPGMPQPSGQLKEASLPASVQQCLHSDYSAFCIHPANCSKYSAFPDVRPFPADKCPARYYALANLVCTLTSAASTWSLNQGYRFRLGRRSPQVRTLAFPAHLPHLLLWPLVASGFAVIGLLPRPHSLLLGSCPSGRMFASAFLQTPSRNDPLAFR